MSNQVSVLSKDSKAARRIIAEIIYHASASHIASAFSIVEILRAIYRNVGVNKIFHWAEDRDRVILSKGHGAAALYVVMHQFGLMGHDDLESYGKNGSLMSGHVSHFIPRIEHSTGALGHGLSVGVGVSIGLKAKHFLSRVFVVTGDGEMHEGSNWEACMFAGHLKLNKLCVLVDANNLCGITHTEQVCSLEPWVDKFRAFGFIAYEVDGHNEEALCNLIRKTSDSDRPVAIVCRTVKGKGVSFIEHQNVWHYRPPNKEALEKILAELA